MARKPSRLPSSPMKLSIGDRQIFLPQPARAVLRSSVKFATLRLEPARVHKQKRYRYSGVFYLALACCFGSIPISCSNAPAAQPDALTFLLESMPTNLDPRIATDAFSQRLDGL